MNKIIIASLFIFGCAGIEGTDGTDGARGQRGAEGEDGTDGVAGEPGASGPQSEGGPVLLDRWGRELGTPMMVPAGDGAALAFLAHSADPAETFPEGWVVATKRPVVYFTTFDCTDQPYMATTEVTTQVRNILYPTYRDSVATGQLWQVAADAAPESRSFQSMKIHPLLCRATTDEVASVPVGLSPFELFWEEPLEIVAK